MQIPFSVFTAPHGQTLGKTVAWHDDKLVKRLQGSVAGGSVLRASASSLTDFIAQAAALTERQALAQGLCEFDEARVLSKKQLLCGTDQGNCVARTRNCFSWHDGWGVLFLDYDPRPGSVPWLADELVWLLRQAVPAFLQATIAHKASSSSFLFAPDGTSIVGLNGQHLFVLVRDARLIPVLAERIVDQLWLAGHGRYDLSANGSLLERTIFDVTVWQPERLIFTRASCLNGILQKLPQTKVFAGAYDELFGEEIPLNEELLTPLTLNEVQRLAHIKSLAKAGVQPAAKAARQAWIEEQLEEAVKTSSTSADREHLRVSMRAALEGGFLPPELVLTTEHGEHVSVGKLLENPNRWHGTRFADPVEPGYRGDRRIAVALLTDPKRPIIYSHAHGGTTYLLRAEALVSKPEDFENLTLSEPSHGPIRVKFAVLPANEFAAGKPPSWLIKSVLPQAGLAMMYGPSGSGKSFLALDIIWAIATGKDWLGLRTKGGRVVYVAAEGVSGFRSRLKAYEAHSGPTLDEINLGVIQDTPDLRGDDGRRLAEQIIASGGAVLIVIDTFAQVAAGADENSAEDIAPILRRCTKLIEETGATVLLIHHSGKDVARGSRGWSGIKGALDTEIEVGKAGDLFFSRVTKQKDGSEGEDLFFKLIQVHLGEDEDGDPVTSCVVTRVTDPKIPPKHPAGKWQKIVMQAFSELEEFGGVSRAALVKSSIMLANETFGLEQGQGRRPESIRRAVHQLEEDEAIRLEDPLVFEG